MKFTCDICNYQTEDKSNIKGHNKSSRHLKKAAGESTKKLFKCTECNYESYNWSNYNKHQQSHKGERKYAYHCKACNKGFKDNFNLSIHYKSSKHGNNVIEKFPETVIQKLTGVRLDLTKRNQYITKLTKTVKCGEKKVAKKKAKEEQPVVHQLISEIKKKIKIFSDLDLEIANYVFTAEHFEDLENKTQDELVDTIDKIDDVLSCDKDMIEFIQETGFDGCAACKLYNYKKLGNCKEHE